jgi:hypothetical protein
MNFIQQVVCVFYPRALVMLKNSVEKNPENLMQMTDMLIPINPLYTCTVLPRYIAT